VFSGFRRRLFEHSREVGGVHVVRCFSTTSRTASLVGRFFENMSFGLFGGLAMVMLPRPDVVYANSWPLFASGIAVLVGQLRRIPVVVSIQDVYPESLLSLGRLRNGSIAARLLRCLDVRIAHLASEIIVISRRAEQTYLSDRGIPAHRVHLIPNWRQCEELPSAEKVRMRRERWGISAGTFLCVFAGNIAAACGIEGLIRAASSLPIAAPVQLVVAGSGSAIDQCRNLAGCNGCERIVFNGPFEAQETAQILSTADILILPTHGDQSLVSMPSKLISYMLAARPVLAVARLESDLAKTVKESCCGWVVEPGDSEQLARQISLAVAMDRSALTRMGLLGREYALTHFSTEACLPKVIGVLEGAMKAVPRSSNGARTNRSQRF